MEEIYAILALVIIHFGQEGERLSLKKFLGELHNSLGIDLTADEAEGAIVDALIGWGRGTKKKDGPAAERSLAPVIANHRKASDRTAVLRPESL